MLLLGIDPGMEGGAAMYDGTSLEVIDLPTVGEGAARRINAPALRDWIAARRPGHAFVEGAQSMPRQGVSSAFRYGRAAGAIEAIVACCGVPFTLVAPGAWKRHHGLSGPDKEKSRVLAVRLFPASSSDLARKRDHGRAEAALIAAYGLAWLNRLAAAA